MADSDRVAALAQIGARVRQRRRESNKTQEALAEAAGVSKSFISEVESGRTAASGLVYLGIAEALDVPVEWLLSGIERTDVPRMSIRHPSPLLSRLAEEHHWSFRKTMDLAAALDGIVARRTEGGKEWEPTSEYILRLAEAIPDENA